MIFNKTRDIMGIQHLRRQLRGMRNVTSLPFKNRSMLKIKPPYSISIKKNKIFENNINDIIFSCLNETQFSGIGNSAPISGSSYPVIMRGKLTNRTDFVNPKDNRTSDTPSPNIPKSYHPNLTKKLQSLQTWNVRGRIGN